MTLKEVLCVFAFLTGFCTWIWILLKRKTESENIIPLSVNYHFTRACNYACKFCFHTDKSKVKRPILEDAQRLLGLLYQAGSRKINFSGGEPFLFPKLLGEMCRFSKEQGFESVSIVSNGSRITRAWFESYGKFVDILAVSCDSFKVETNITHGRMELHRDTRKFLLQVAKWCNEFQVGFKINSVITRINASEDMSKEILKLNPCRWKVFQCLLIKGENTGGPGERRDATDLVISDDQFNEFVKRHLEKGVLQIVPESNRDMKDSYLIVDEEFRFLNCRDGAKTPSRSILEVGVAIALEEAGWDIDAFHRRRGVYRWKKEEVVHSPRDLRDIEDLIQ
jgi:radical S-adenosyl methionine domain-containing protein 2